MKSENVLKLWKFHTSTSGNSVKTVLPPFSKGISSKKDIINSDREQSLTFKCRLPFRRLCLPESKQEIAKVVFLDANS